MRILKKYIICVWLFACSYNTEAQTSVLSVADTLMTKGDYKNALRVLHEVENPPHQIIHKIATIYHQSGNYSKAISFYDMSYAQQPSDLTKEQIGKCYLALGNQLKAITLFEEVVAAHPENLNLRASLAKLYLAERKSKKAIELFKALEEADPDNPNYSFQLGMAYLGQGKSFFFKSISSFLATYNKDSMHLKSIYQLAKAYEDLKFKDSTLLFIRKGLAISPKHINFNQLLVKESYRQQQYDTALVYLDRLDTLGFKTKFTATMYGLCYLEKHDYEKAKAKFTEARGFEFNDPLASYHLGLAEMGLKEYPSAIRNFNLSIILAKPSLEDQYLQLGAAYTHQQQLKKALEAYEKGVENAPENAALMFQWALLSEQYYKDKSIALDRYESYLNRFTPTQRDAVSTRYARQQIKAISKALFMDVEMEK